MTQDEYALKLEELDQLLNDPDVPMDPGRVWRLLAELSGRDLGSAAQRLSGRVGAMQAAMMAGTAD